MGKGLPALLVPTIGLFQSSSAALLVPAIGLLDPSVGLLEDGSIAAEIFNCAIRPTVQVAV